MDHVLQQEPVWSCRQSKFKGFLFIDPGIFNFINQYNGAVANKRDIPDHQGSGLSAAELVEVLLNDTGSGVMSFTSSEFLPGVVCRLRQR